MKIVVLTPLFLPEGNELFAAAKTTAWLLERYTK
jgi:hypothetical protein